MTAVLESRRLGRRAPLGGGWLLRDVSLAVAPGQKLGISGPSGAGKTVLLRALALLDAPDEGEVLFDGAPIADEDVPDFRRQVVYLHQRAALLEGSVEDNLRRPFELRAHRGKRFSPSLADELLAALGRPAGFRQKATGDLSGGEAQALALVRAVQLSPRVLLLDEATSAMDPRTTGAAEALLDIWLAEDDGRALVWVAHDEGQLRRVTDTLLRIEAGRLAAR